MNKEMQSMLNFDVFEEVKMAELLSSDAAFGGLRLPCRCSCKLHMLTAYLS